MSSARRSIRARSTAGSPPCGSAARWGCSDSSTACAGCAGTSASSCSFDLPARKFNVFWWTFYPQDFLYLALLLILAALALFFFTSLAGRLWCGYACPQTVYTEVFLWIERKIEGDRPRQMKLDRAPWGGRKIALKSAKHAVWIAFSLWTGFTFVGYFTPVTELGGAVLRLETGPWETFWILFYGLATYGNAGWLREQVCIYMCPYARFQSAMFDRDTLVISYDTGRGEPRGSRKRGTDHRAAGLGDCINCTMCVQVCPTGIDIRDGLQHECIACAACVDVCDQVMERMGYPKGLVRYTTQNAVEGRPTRIVRPRTLVYAGGLAALLAVFAGSLALRVPAELDVIRDRNALYRETAEGLIRNVYTLKIVNMHDEPLRWRISASGIEGLRLEVERGDREVAPGEVASVPVRLDAPRDALGAASTPYASPSRRSAPMTSVPPRRPVFLDPLIAETRDSAAGPSSRLSRADSDPAANGSAWLRTQERS